LSVLALQAIPVVTVQSLKGQLVYRQVVQPDEDPIEVIVVISAGGNSCVHVG
jgi:hypothetical protein